MSNKEIIGFLKPFLIKEKKHIIISVILALGSSLIGVIMGIYRGMLLMLLVRWLLM